MRNLLIGGFLHRRIGDVYSLWRIKDVIDDGGPAMFFVCAWEARKKGDKEKWAKIRVEIVRIEIKKEGSLYPLNGGKIMFYVGDDIPLTLYPCSNHPFSIDQFCGFNNKEWVISR
jgi:hypothetical protein